MLQPAAASATSALSLKPGAQGDKAEKSDIPAGFAALLAEKEPQPKDGEADPETLVAAVANALRQAGAATGNQAGKILPEGLPGDEKVAGDTDGGETSETSGTSTPDPMVSVLALTQAVPALSVAAPTVEKAVAPPPGKAATQVTAKGTKTTAGTTGQVTAPVPTDKLAAAIAATTAASDDQAKVKLTVDLPGKKDSGVTTTKAASPLATSDALANANRPTAADGSAQANAGAGGSSQDRQAMPDSRPSSDTNESHGAKAAGKFSAAADATPNGSAQPTAAELQPVMAMRDAQPAAPQPGAGVPAVGSASSAQHGGHDFSTLVDRLVEARDAATPQTVRAAIHHTDFGQISLNFRADDARLNVSMSSADPDFAPAVQAAAAMHSQSQASADNSSNGNQRQDNQHSQQNSANSASAGQPQSQSQGSARGGEGTRADANRQANAGQSTAARDEEKTQAQGSGIYA